ncbi:SnoaL-like protein [Mucilaginibacter gracilis]|uniref:SnoaL-like protein n=1 Tax=Mucilaginibacter gracilis TaxID=423350 RepID=A0A495J1R3_9SPHI|nr:nuclear transport factor 2 family protein [Mucilaginibacter gracilis]RKR82268.1 SnoaL-like protein [Mucilaginibacter gracilis]
MYSNEKLILDFYDNLRKGDVKKIGNFYAKNATFRDPIFISLNASQASAMWAMVVKEKDFQIDIKKIDISDRFLTADCTLIWTCENGKKVLNDITSRFAFNTDGKILLHSNHFDVYKLVKQTTGTIGVLFGWTKVLRNRTRRLAAEKLNYFMKEQNYCF